MAVSPLDRAAERAPLSAIPKAGEDRHDDRCDNDADRHQHCRLLRDRRKLRSDGRDRHRVGGGRAGRGRCSDPRGAGAPAYHLVSNDQRNAGEHNNGKSEEDAEAGEGREKRVQIDGVAQREGEEGDHQLAAGGEKLPELGVEIAEREADQERKHGADKDLRLEMRRSGCAQDDHAHQRAGLDRGQHKSPGFLLGAVGLHQRRIKTAVGHIDGADDRENRQTRKEAALNPLRRNELGGNQNDRPGGEEFGQHERA
jgi:hypothetical protein